MAIKSQGLIPTWHVTTALITVSICTSTILAWLLVPNQHRLNKREVRIKKANQSTQHVCTTENARTKNSFQVVRMTTAGFMSAQNIRFEIVY